MRIAQREREALIKTSGERAYAEGFRASEKIAARVLEVEARPPERLLAGAEVLADPDGRQTGNRDGAARQVAAAVDDLEAEAPRQLVRLRFVQLDEDVFLRLRGDGAPRIDLDPV